MGDALHGLAAAADSMDGSETTAEVDGAPAAGNVRKEEGKKNYRTPMQRLTDEIAAMRNKILTQRGKITIAQGMDLGITRNTLRLQKAEEHLAKYEAELKKKEEDLEAATAKAALEAQQKAGKEAKAREQAELKKAMSEAGAVALVIDRSHYDHKFTNSSDTNEKCWEHVTYSMPERSNPILSPHLSQARAAPKKAAPVKWWSHQPFTSLDVAAQVAHPIERGFGVECGIWCALSIDTRAAPQGNR